jgi:hypothetical protein
MFESSDTDQRPGLSTANAGFVLGYSSGPKWETIDSGCAS